MKNKVYVVLFDDDKVIYPVKAKYIPYKKFAGKLAYCSGLPQFFGGNDDGKELTRALGDEVWQESNGVYNFRGCLHYIMDNVISDARYAFYCANGWTTTDNTWPMTSESWNKLPCKTREMCWNATAPRSAFSKLDLKDVDNASLIDVLIAQAQVGAPDWAQAQMATASTTEFATSETYAAFAIFLRNWLGADSSSSSSSSSSAASE